MGKFLDKTGMRYGRLVVLECLGRRTYPSGCAYTAVKCQCDCGNQVIKDISQLGKSVFSCGCLRRERMSKVGGSNKTHGLGRTSEYKTWKKLLTNHAAECPPSWQRDLNAFIFDVGNRPSPKHYLTRRDPTAPFDKKNAYWRTSQLRQLPSEFDLTGMRFGKLLVMEVATHRSPRSPDDRYWVCLCDCGNRSIVSRNNLFKDNALSCGCIRPQLHSVIHTTHGISARHLSEYSTWCSMVSVCTKPHVSSYRHYGARGITVCDRWMNHPEHFIEDMGLRPGPQFRLERIDKNKGFSKANCHWVPRQIRKKKLKPDNEVATRVKPSSLVNNHG